MPKGKWTPPKAGKNAPQKVKDILAAVYSNCRDKHPAETKHWKMRCAKQAWGAVENAGWRRKADGTGWYRIPTNRKKP